MQNNLKIGDIVRYRGYQCESEVIHINNTSAYILIDESGVRLRQSLIDRLSIDPIHLNKTYWLVSSKDLIFIRHKQKEKCVQCKLIS